MVLCRHAQSPGVSVSSGLTSAGDSQAAELARFIQQLTAADGAAAASGVPPVTRVCASTFTRAVATAEPLAAALSLSVDPQAEICEWELPRLEGTLLLSYPLSHTHTHAHTHTHTHRLGGTCLCARARARACVRECVRACVSKALAGGTHALAAGRWQQCRRAR